MRPSGTFLSARHTSKRLANCCLPSAPKQDRCCTRPPLILLTAGLHLRPLSPLPSNKLPIRSAKRCSSSASKPDGQCTRPPLDFLPVISTCEDALPSGGQEAMLPSIFNALWRDLLTMRRPLRRSELQHCCYDSHLDLRPRRIFFPQYWHNGYLRL